MIIDVHAHVFPDKIADRAGDAIGSFYDIPCVSSGTVEELKQINKSANINKTIICSAAVTPDRVKSINDFISETYINNKNEFIGFGSIHPEFPELENEIKRIKSLGLHGIKIHPDFQKFMLDDNKSLIMFEIAAENNIPFLVHVGDLRKPYSDPKKMRKVLDSIKNLKVICAHLGGWSIWNEGWKHLADCEGVWVDTSSSLYAINNKTAMEIINRYDENRVMFGSDFPMWSPKTELQRFNNLPFSENKKEKILYKNALEFFSNFDIKI